MEAFSHEWTAHTGYYQPWISGRLLRVTYRRTATRSASKAGASVDHQWRTLAGLPAWSAPGQVGLSCSAPPAIGERVTLRGPQGGAFDLSRTSPRALLLGQLDSLAELLFLADQLRQQPNRIKLLLLLEAHGELPFQPQPSRIIVPDLPSWVIAALPLCEDWNSQPYRTCWRGWLLRRQCFCTRRTMA